MVGGRLIAVRSRYVRSAGNLYCRCSVLFSQSTRTRGRAPSLLASQARLCVSYHRLTAIEPKNFFSVCSVSAIIDALFKMRRQLLRRARMIESTRRARPNFFSSNPLKSPKTAKEKFGKISWARCGRPEKKGIFPARFAFFWRLLGFPNFCRRACYGPSELGRSIRRTSPTRGLL